VGQNSPIFRKKWREFPQKSMRVQALNIVLTKHLASIYWAPTSSDRVKGPSSGGVPRGVSFDSRKEPFWWWVRRALSCLEMDRTGPGWRNKPGAAVEGWLDVKVASNGHLNEGSASRQREAGVRGQLAAKPGAREARARNLKLSTAFWKTQVDLRRLMSREA